MNKIITMMIGLPRSGKSTYVEKYYGDSIIISRDKIRLEVFGRKNDFSNEQLVEQMHQEKMMEAVANNQSFVLDNTMLKYAYRLAVYQFAKKHGYKVNVCIAYTPIEIIKKRCEETNFDFEIILKMMNGYDLFDVRQDELSMVNNAGIIKTHDRSVTMIALKALRDAMEYDQQNKHHSLVLGEHLIQTFKYIEKMSDNEILKLAGKYHDIGKPYCRQLQEDGGYSYRGHDKMSAYMIMTYMKTPSSQIDGAIAFLILHHMYRFQKDLGAKFWKKFEINAKRHNVSKDDLFLLWKADELAH